MFSSNPFALLTAYVPAAAIQGYVVLMVVSVIGGTLFDVIHKGSARYFFRNWQAARARGRRQLADGEMASLVAKTLCHEVLASGEFCNAKRRAAHLLTMYGFVAYALATAVMVFGYPTLATPTPVFWPVLWHLGALMVCVGGYWFWFFIRVDVAAEGNSPFRVMYADLFILSLLASATFALVWSWCIQRSGHGGWHTLILMLYALATAKLFMSVPWSKFAHMFFKPAAALQKRVAEADGSRGNLPPPTDKPEIFGSNKRLPQNY